MPRWRRRAALARSGRRAEGIDPGDQVRERRRVQHAIGAVRLPGSVAIDDDSLDALAVVLESTDASAQHDLTAPGFDATCVGLGQRADPAGAWIVEAGGVAARVLGFGSQGRDEGVPQRAVVRCVDWPSPR